YWPPQSPVLNPIKNVCDSMEDYLGQKYERASTLEVLERQLYEAYEAVSTDKVKEFIYSMPFRLQQVIERGGGKTDW
ncbi:hypothetical protein EX30DRAFT_306948, partial [Ascodesmis nigricans]